MNSSSNAAIVALENALHTLQIIQAVHAIFVTFALPPVAILLYLLPKIALHNNCKFLLYAWLSAFTLSILSHAAFIMCDIISGKYIPASSSDPAFRDLTLGAHGFAHAFSSVQELMFSIERAFACASPSIYHDRGLSLVPLLLGETGAILLAAYYYILLTTDRLILGCVITNVIDVLALVCLIVTKMWTDKKTQLLLSGLNAKYQIQEAFEITKVMLPCGVISLILKTFAMFMAWMFGLHVIDSKYAFTVTSGLYLIIETTNGIICSTLFLTIYPRLRRSVSHYICRRKMLAHPVATPDGRSSDIHFNSLKNVWK